MRNHPATLLDISLTGARIELSPHIAPPPSLVPGETVLLQWAELDRIGQLVWSEGLLAGITFDEHLSPHEIIATRDLQDSFVDEGGLERFESTVAKAWYEGRSH